MQRLSTARLTRLLVVVVGIALTISVLACETAEPEPTPTPTAEPTVTTPISDVLVEDEVLMVDYETQWGEYFETLSEGEVSCIRSALEEDDYDGMLARQVVSGERVTDRHELEIWACLTQENAIDLYLSDFYTFRPDGDRTDDELAEVDACHRSLLQYVDFARYLEASATDIHVTHGWYVPRKLTLISDSMRGCWFNDEAHFIPYSMFPVYEARPINFVPSDSLTSSSDEISIWRDGLDDISEEERDCIRNEIGSDGYETLLDEAIFDGETEPRDVVIWGCLGKETAVSFLKRIDAFDVLTRLVFYRRDDERYDEQLVRDYVPCMDRVLERLDIPRLIAAGLPDVGPEDYRHGVAAIMGFGLCLGPPSVVELDDHSDEIEGATEIAIGNFIKGNIEAKFYKTTAGRLNTRFKDGTELDVFQFVAEPGLVYKLDLNYGNWGPNDSPDDMRPYFLIEVFSLDGYGFSTSSPVLWETSSSGVHYLVVTGTGTFPYEFEISISDYLDDFGSDFGAATEIPIGGTVEGTIGQLNEHDYFKFVAERGVSYQLDVELSDDYLRPNLGRDDLTVTLIDTNRNPSGEISDRWAWQAPSPVGEISDRWVWQAPSSGEFFIEVSGRSRSHQGSYAISVSASSYSDDHGDDPGSATEIALGGNALGSLGTDVDEDYFYFDAMSGQSYEMSVETDFDGSLVFDLVDADGDSIALEKSSLIWQAIDDGRYFIRIWSEEIVDYSLSLKASDYVDDHPANEPTVVQVSQPIEGHIINSSDLDVFSFFGVAGEAYDIEVEFGALNKVTMSFYDSEGEWLEWSDEGRFTLHAWESGDYLVYLYSSTGGAYTFTVSSSDYRDDHGDDEENATVLEFGETVSGVIGFDAGYHWYSVVSGQGDPDVFSFETERGRLYQIDVEPGSLLRSRFRLFDSAYDVWVDADTHLLWEAERSDTYYVMVNGLGVGDYELTVDRFDYSNDHGNDFSSATPIEVGETLSGTIGLAPEFDFFRFTATEGEAYEIHLKREGLKKPQVSLFDADGTELGVEPDFTKRSVVINIYLILNVEGLASKDYYIVVGSRIGSWHRPLDDDWWAQTSLDDPQYGGDYRLSIALLE